MSESPKIHLRSSQSQFKSNKVYKKRKPLNEIEYSAQKLFNYAINRLSSRDYARKELFDKMNRFKTQPGDIEKTLDRLAELGYINDERRAKSLVTQYSKKESLHKIKNRLTQKGISRDLAQSVIEQANEEQIENPAVELLNKKFKIYDKNNWDKMVRFLASKGFRYDEISKAIRAFAEES